MPRKPPSAENEPVPADASVTSAQSAAPAMPPVEPPPAEPAATTTAAQTRSRRKRRLVWLSVAFTTLVGAVWTTLASSLVDSSRDYFTAKLQDLQGVTEIQRLKDEKAQLEIEHNAVLTQKEKEYDMLLAQTGLGITAYVRLAFRSQQFCINEVKGWAKENNYPFEEVGDPDSYISRVIYFGANLEIRCVGARFSPVTFLVVSGTAAAGSKSVDGAQAALSTRLDGYNAYPAIVSPNATNWTSNGPYVEVGYLTLEMTYVDFQRWETGTIPPAIQSTLTRPGTMIRRYESKGYFFIAADEPGSSVTLRSPDTDGFTLLVPDGTWKPKAEVLAANTVPLPETRVRTRLVVAIAGLTYGQYEVNSPQQRYLGQDAMERLATLPGVVDGGRIETFLRSW